jgi:hypothetical protein
VSLGGRLLTLQKDDFDKCVSFFKTFSTDENSLIGDHELLIKTAHKIAFTMSLWTQKVSGVPEWDKQHLLQLKADATGLLPSIAFGNKRTLHLYERACIEDFLRYFYYYDHQIEQLLLRSNPTKYETIDFLLNWVKEYPLLQKYKDALTRACNNLSSAYSQLSRTVHGNSGTIEINLRDSLVEIFKPIENPEKERELLSFTFQNILFIFALFHLNDYGKLTIDEMRLVCQHFSREQKGVLSS